MPGVLGKRPRASTFAVVIAPQPESVLQRTGGASPLCETHAILDEEAATAKSVKKQRRNSVQHTQPSTGRLPLSPQKLNTIFKTSKAPAEQLKQPECPKTPRHRDSVKKPVTTPRHRVSLVGKPLTPHRGKLFSPSVAVTPTTVLTTAKTLFSRGSAPGRLIGRDDERKQLREFLEPRITSRSGGCLYVSGPPGCGKSALLTEVMGDLGTEKLDNVKTAYINCMAIKDPKGIYSKLLEEFFTEEVLSSPTGMEDLEGLFINKKKKKKALGGAYVVVLDEIDHLLTKDQEVLYSIFEWSLMRGSRLILLGIANALDLTDRFLPRLKARNLTPQLLPFLPYTAPQIAAVITSRLRSLLPDGNETPGDFVPFMHPAAIQLASRKVAGATGDLRKVFDICRRAVELVESEACQREQAQERSQGQDSKPLDQMTKSLLSSPRNPLVENSNFSSPRALGSMLSSLTIETAPRATIAHVARVSSSSFGGSSISRVKILNLQQKAVLCCLATTEKTKGSVTIRKLFEVYTSLCKKERLLHPVSSTEFRDVVTSLEVAGVVNLMSGGGLGTPSKRGRASGGGIDGGRISACVREMDLLTAVADVGPILTRLFSDSK